MKKITIVLLMTIATILYAEEKKYYVGDKIKFSFIEYGYPNEYEFLGIYPNGNSYILEVAYYTAEKTHEYILKTYKISASKNTVFFSRTYKTYKDFDYSNPDYDSISTYQLQELIITDIQPNCITFNIKDTDELLVEKTNYKKRIFESDVIKIK